MKIRVQYRDEHRFLDASLCERLTSLCQTAAEHLGMTGGEISVTLVNDEQIKALNRQYRRIDEPTDVLSFPMYAREEWFDNDKRIIPDDGSAGPPLWGDIIISVPTARAQADAYGHSFEREIGFLFIHGFLHLVGYDHDNEENEQEMFRLQEEILAKQHLVR